MLVRDVMTPDPVTLKPGDSLSTAKARMKSVRCRRLPIVDEAGNLCGIITDRDLRLAENSPLIMRERWQDDLLIEHTTVDACMTSDPISITPDAPLERAIEIMLAQRISGLPVVEETRLVGIITVTDLLQALARLLESLNRS
ncbi:MAG: CBS domain-containing protein [Anaerolineae bacterium]|nr:CBS domain-containing protein [Anaerolineae bacterium]